MSRRRRQITPTSFLRRRSTRWLIGGLVLLAVAGILGAISRNGAGPREVADATATTVATQLASPTPLPVQTQVMATPSVTIVTPPALSPDPALLTSATVTNVVDGDTIDVMIDGAEERVRYYGIDTPERGVACFTEATERNRELVGDTVLLLPDARDRDRYGRLLRYVFDADGDSIDAQLIAEGLARAWRDDGAYRDQLVALEVEADRADVGCLWG
jgi:micrococcal nuclease